jgi:hypothetical protein
VLLLLLLPVMLQLGAVLLPPVRLQWGLPAVATASSVQAGTNSLTKQASTHVQQYSSTAIHK